MGTEGKQNVEIIVKQEPFQDDGLESNEDFHISDSKQNVEIIVKQEPFQDDGLEINEDFHISNTNNVHMLLPLIKDEIKKEDSCISSAPGVCQVWLDSNGGEQYYSENCKVELEEDDEENDPEESEPLPDFQEYFPEIMPHFLSEVTEPDPPSQSKLVNCHKCGELCKSENFMEHIQSKHTKRRILQTKEKAPKSRRRYTNKYLYPCPYCQQTKRTFSALKFHILFHTQEKPYKCPFCDYRGNQQSSVDFHIQTKHYNTKPYQCKICDYSSCTLKCLKNHNKTHRSTYELRQCPYCDLSTYKLLAYQRHVKKCRKKKMKSKTDEVCIGNKDNNF